MTIENFRAATRAWLEQNCPPGMRTPMPEGERVWGGKQPLFKHPESRIWMERMVERGWTAPTWPREFGGGGLASLQTRCEDRGDHYLVNGQKIWTSYADPADWIFCLVRTDTMVKHAGISFLLFDMGSPGVTVRPIKLISGASAFCEAFFDDVRVPKDQLICELNGGWVIAKKLLGHERSMISQMGNRGGGRLPPIEDMVRRYTGDADGRITDPAIRDLLVRHLINDRAFHYTSKRAMAGGDAIYHRERYARLIGI
jgi:alkylation response protein AidB-like acyl-CoA dehydrogenase